MVPHIHSTQVILYVSDQERSRRFYGSLLRAQPSLHVPGMTEFVIAGNLKLGLMPEAGIARLLGDSVPHPSSGSGIPRCELYLYVSGLTQQYENALQCGAQLISPIAPRDWGDDACYFADPDGHIIAFAEKIA